MSRGKTGERLSFCDTLRKILLKFRGIAGVSLAKTVLLTESCRSFSCLHAFCDSHGDKIPGGN